MLSGQQKWKYKLVYMRLTSASGDPPKKQSKKETKLNKLGERGWEAVGLIPRDSQGHQATILLKKPVAS